MSHERKRKLVISCIYRSLYRKITPILFDIAMVLCIIVGCSNKTGKSLKKKDSVRFSRVPKIVKNGGEMLEELTIRRRRAWLSAISRDDLTEDKLENETVCSRHFVSGQAAKPCKMAESKHIFDRCKIAFLVFC